MQKMVMLSLLPCIRRPIGQNAAAQTLRGACTTMSSPCAAFHRAPQHAHGALAAVSCCSASANPYAGERRLQEAAAVALAGGGGCRGEREWMGWVPLVNLYRKAWVELI